MRLDLPNSFDVAPLVSALHDVAESQGHHVYGEWRDNELVLVFKPRPTSTASERIRALGEKVDSALSFELLPSTETHESSQDAHPKVVSILDRRMARGRSAPPSAA